MRAWSWLSSLLRNLLRRDRVERDLDAELTSWIDTVSAENVAAGLTPEQARRQARVALGGFAQVKEEVRTVRAGAWLEAAVQDVCFGVRQLRSAPVLTGVVVLTLAVGIGTSTAVFGLAHALFTRLASVPNAGRLVYVSRTIQGRTDAMSFPLSFADYTYFREHSRSFAELAAHYSGAPLHVVHDGEPSAIYGGVVTHNYFAALGLSPAHGRFFTPEEDDEPGRAPVVVIAYDLWERQFDRDPQVIGRTIHVNGVAFSVIGVAPPAFASERPGQLALSVWIPSAMFRTGYRYCDAFQRGCAIVSLTGLLKRDVTVEAARSELDVLARQLEAAYPATNEGRGVLVVPAQGVAPDQQTETRPTVQLLAGAIAVVLAVACANVAALLFVRGVARRREVAVRLAIGASRSRVVRQFLTESLLLALIGGAAGLFVAGATAHLLVAYYGVTYTGSALALDISFDSRVLLFTLALSLATGVVFGVIPAFQSSGTHLVASIRDDGARGGTPRSRLRDALVVAQVALSVVLLIGAGLMTRSLKNLHRGPGFDPSQIVLLRLRPSLIDYDVPKAWAFQMEVNERIAALPGVEAVSSAVHPPLPGWGAVEPVWLPGQEPADRARVFSASLNAVGPAYFETLGLAVVEGRPFLGTDDDTAPRVAVVNQTLANHFWPRQHAIGRTLIVNGVSCEVIGVARDAQYRAVTESRAPLVYTSYAQQDQRSRFNGDSRTHVRVAADPAAMLPLLRRAVSAVDRNVPISEDQLLTDRVDYHFRHVRALSTMLVTLGAIAVLLSAVALYAVLSLVVRQRTREIAIRMALGARQADVSRAVVQHGLALCAGGAGLGLLAAAPATRLLRSVLFGVTPDDPSTWLGVACLLAIVGGIACYLPARHAARVQPIGALRGE